jgi:predicted nucleic acid-binding protein
MVVVGEEDTIVVGEEGTMVVGAEDVEDLDRVRDLLWEEFEPRVSTKQGSKAGPVSVLSSKFGRDREGLSHIAVTLSELAELLTPARRVKISKDEPDNRILECAIYGEADLLVTGDKEILILREYKGKKIITLKEYLEL